MLLQIEPANQRGRTDAAPSGLFFFFWPWQSVSTSLPSTGLIGVWTAAKVGRELNRSAAVVSCPFYKQLEIVSSSSSSSLLFEHVIKQKQKQKTDFIASIPVFICSNLLKKTNICH